MYKTIYNTMKRRPKVPMFWICFITTTTGFICSFFAMILPFWYTRYPQSQNRFVRLGLWEICFEGYMSKEVGNHMYFGCFYLFDGKMLPLWSIIFRAWFIACQTSYTCSFLTYILAQCTILTQAVRLVSFRGSRAVLCTMVTLSLNCILTLVSLITMGVGVDTEQKIEKSVKNPWLEDLGQNSLSWSYGLAAVSIFPSWLTVILLGWFVYPKRSPCGLLSISAWEWPTLDDLQCRYHIKDLQTPKISAFSNPQSSCCITGSGDHSYPYLSRRSEITSNLTAINQSIESNNNNNNILRKPKLFHKSRVQPESSAMIRQDQGSLSDIGGKLSSYDPRSADTVSLSSYEQLPFNMLYNQPKCIKMGEFTSVINSNVYNSIHNHSLSKSNRFKLLSLSSRCRDQKSNIQWSSIKECTDEQQHKQHHSKTYSHQKPLNSYNLFTIDQPSLSNPDTSIWTENEIYSKSIDYNTIFQAARPMKRIKQVQTDQLIKKLLPSENIINISPFSTTVNHSLIAKPMVRKR
ncbi:unnamed protein product [Heterobilharzia americana]|nr:unnamed protein product [Heterobilharzia americana]